MVSSDKGADFIILQFEMYSYMGTIVQCADMLVEKVSSYKSEKCDPALHTLSIQVFTYVDVSLIQMHSSSGWL